MRILELKDIHKSFGQNHVLNGIDLYLDRGEIVGILGVSGSGKSTIFNIISGTMREDSGQVFINKEQVRGSLGLVSYMLQKDLLLDHFTILDNVLLPVRIKNGNLKEATSRVIELLPDFGLEGIENSYPKELSGGMRQRAALLRTYMNQSELILLDEPFSAIDMITKDSMHQWFLDIIQKLNLSGLFITHDIDEAIKLSDRIYILGTDGVFVDQFEIQRPEDLEEFQLSEEFLSYKKRVLKSLKK